MKDLIGSSKCICQKILTLSGKKNELINNTSFVLKNAGFF